MGIHNLEGHWIHPPPQCGVKSKAFPAQSVGKKKQPIEIKQDPTYQLTGHGGPRESSPVAEACPRWVELKNKPKFQRPGLTHAPFGQSAG